jgi:hypothetical protein
MCDLWRQAGGAHDAPAEPNSKSTTDWLQGYCLGDGGWAKGGVSKKTPASAVKEGRV